MNIFSIYISIYAHTDLGMRSRTFSLKHKLPYISEIPQAWQCLNIVFIWSGECTY